MTNTLSPTFHGGGVVWGSLTCGHQGIRGWRTGSGIWAIFTKKKVKNFTDKVKKTRIMLLYFPLETLLHQGSYLSARKLKSLCSPRISSPVKSMSWTKMAENEQVRAFCAHVAASLCSKKDACGIYFSASNNHFNSKNSNFGGGINTSFKIQ